MAACILAWTTTMSEPDWPSNRKDVDHHLLVRLSLGLHHPRLFQSVLRIPASPSDQVLGSRADKHALGIALCP
jgi:hypothetical protein